MKSISWDRTVIAPMASVLEKNLSNIPASPGVTIFETKSPWIGDPERAMTPEIGRGDKCVHMSHAMEATALDRV